MRILLVEDARALARSIAQGLAEEGFSVDVAGDGEEGLHFATEVAYDAIVLDRMLPLLDGLSVLRRLREHGVGTPVLLLTALGELQDRVEGLDGGADDYLVKPFAFLELAARLRALLRRPASRVDAIALGALEIDPLRRHVRRGDVVLNLTPKEFDLLLCLASRPGDVL
ncbi:MAG TPA: response regulator, partial [Anaeromyxobacteraceae bacterium]|nr:response regulator [Anaeromyxobacteraceae bacterium]